MDFVFNVVNIPAGEGRVEQRHGVCTGHLDRITSNLQVLPGKDLSTHMEQLHIDDIPRVSRVTMSTLRKDAFTKSRTKRSQIAFCGN